MNSFIYILYMIDLLDFWAIVKRIRFKSNALICIISLACAVVRSVDVLFIVINISNIEKA